MIKFVLVVALFAALVYGLLWSIERRRTLGGPPPARPRQRRGPSSRPVAPDDDEDFLRWLDRKRRKDPPH